MKLIITIPAYNEEKTIVEVIKSIPRNINGINKVEVLVQDDGSTDNTSLSAKRAGADYIFRNKKNLGLAKTFSRAIEKSLELGADIIVNTDADNQYDQREISNLIEPILQNQADMVIGNRRVEKLSHMTAGKKYGNILGSWVIRFLTGADVTDASSGFRAFSREAAASFNILSGHTYTHETIIQATNKDLVITEVSITFKKRPSGESRLISGIVPHVTRSLGTIVRTILMYKAFKFLVAIGIMVISIGLLGIARFAYFFYIGQGSGHVQSLILSSVLISIGFLVIVIGVVADLIKINRQLIEEEIKGARK